MVKAIILFICDQLGGALTHLNFIILILTMLTGKDWCFTQFSTAMAGWLLLIFSISLHNQLSSIHSIISTDV